MQVFAEGPALCIWRVATHSRTSVLLRQANYVGVTLQVKRFAVAPTCGPTPPLSDKYGARENNLL